MTKIIDQAKTALERKRIAWSTDPSAGSLYETRDVEEPSDEIVLAEYNRYREMGGITIEEFEVMQGTYVEPPTLIERTVKLGHQLLRSFGIAQ